MKKVIAWIIIVLIVAGSAAAVIMKSEYGAIAFGRSKVYSVNAEPIKRGEIFSYISAGGFIETTEKADVYFETPLRVVKVLVEKYQKVSKGQKLLELDMDSIFSEIERLKITRETQELSLDTTSLDAEIARAGSALESAQRAYEEALKKHEKNMSLYDAKIISENDLELSRQVVADAERALKNAQLGYDTAVSGKDLNRKTADQSLKSTDFSILELEKNIRKTREAMLCPIDGVIVEINVQKDAYTGGMQPAFTIINPEKLAVTANVREYDIKFVKTGQKVRITGDAIHEDAVVTGTVTGISPIAKANRTTSGEEIVVETTISIDPTDVELRPGLSVTCDISTMESKDVLVAPMEMFDEDKDGNKYAFVVDLETQTMKKVPVKLGISSDMTVEVLDGLREGDLVILNPQPVYKDGDRVKLSGQQ